MPAAYVVNSSWRNTLGPHADILLRPPHFDIYARILQANNAPLCVVWIYTY